MLKLRRKVDEELSGFRWLPKYRKAASMQEEQ
jgi:hypothetical protein